jgi:predicted enzyme related to lactoylglutathione lyase
MPVRDKPWPDGTPCWVDLMTTDVKAANTFYGELFGWDIAAGDESVGFYGMARLEGHDVCGIGPMQGGMEHPPVWTTYLASGDAEATSDAIARAGGTIFAPTMDVMDFGRMAIAQDPTGGAFGVWEAKSHIGYSIANETNTVVWNELMTRDYSAALEFYAAVFSYSYTDLGADGFKYSTIEVSGNTVGGLGELPEMVPAEVPPHWRTYFAVEDCDAVVERVRSLGGSVIRPPADMPYGRHADVADPQGAVFSLIKPASPE